MDNDNSNKQKKLTGIMIVGEDENEVEMSIKGLPENVKSFVKDNNFPAFIKNTIIEEVDWKVNDDKKPHFHIEE